VAVDSSDACVVWQDYRHGYREIYSKWRTESAWGADTRLTNSSSVSANPSAAIDENGEAHVVWHDYRMGNPEIYWKRSFSDSAPAPVASSIYPSSSHSGYVVSVTSLAGANFLAPGFVRLERAGEAHLVGFDVKVVSPAQMTCDIHLLMAQPGDWDVIVQNPDGRADTIASGFEVLPLGKPEIASLDPSSWFAEEIAEVSSLSGDSLAAPMQVWLEMAGEPSIPARNVVVESPQSLSCDIDLAGAAMGARDVVVENPYGLRDTLMGGFHVLFPLWTEETRLTSSGRSETCNGSARSLAVEPSGEAHVVWFDNRDLNNEIYYKHHDGYAWGEDTRLTDAGGDSEYPCVAVDYAGRVHVAWSDMRNGNWEIYYKQHDGVSWSADQRLTFDPFASQYPALAVSPDDNLHLVWQDARNDGYFHIYYKKFDGAAWTPDDSLGGRFNGGLPSIDTDDAGDLHVVFYDRIDTYDADIIYMKHDGIGWSEELHLTDNWSEDWTPCIASDNSGRLHVTWHGNESEEYQIFYRLFDGTEWLEAEMLTYGTGVSANACVDTDDIGNVTIVWRDERDGNREIYMKRCEEGIWLPEQRFTHALDDSRRPTVIVEPSGEQHVVWYDRRNGPADIYYRMRRVDETAGVTGPSGIRCGLGDISIIPNPAIAGCEISFAPGPNLDAVFSVYDVTGRLVWTSESELAEDLFTSTRILWNGKDTRGSRVSPGTYFIRVNASGQTSTAKVIVLR
jgi:hypothetical protein